MKAIMITLAIGVLVFGVPLAVSLLLKGAHSSDQAEDEYGHYSDYL